jgi:hypothetical protein
MGRWMAMHARAVVIAWIAIAVALGTFAPKAERPLRRRLGGQQLRVGTARELIDEQFGGVSAYGPRPSSLDDLTAEDAAFMSAVRRAQEIRRQPDVSAARPSRRPETAIRSSSRRRYARPVWHGRAADDLKGELKAASADGVEVQLTGSRHVV